MEINLLSIKALTNNSGRWMENIRGLRANLEFCGKENQSVLFTSGIPGEGKSTISLSLAVELAKIGKNVLFVDADMRKSRFRERLGLSEKDSAGLSELLSGKRKVTGLIRATDVNHLSVLLAGKVPPNPSELLSRSSFDDLLREAKGVYDYVIVDAPPLGSVIDAAIIGRKCDGTVLVVGSDMLSCRMLSKVVQQLRRADCRILGTVVNKVRQSNRALYGTYGTSRYHYDSYTFYYNQD